MKTIVLTTLALSTMLASCGQKVNTGSSSKYRSTIVLGKYYDLVTPSTFNESELNDLPRVVDLKGDLTSVKNQASRGTCTFFSTTALLEATVKKDQNIEVNLSEEYMNYAAKSQGYFSNTEGSAVQYNLAAIKAKGLLLERDYSYQPSWFDKALPCEKYKADGDGVPTECYTHKTPDKSILKKVISAENITFTGAQKNTNDIIRFLAEEKRPLTLSLPVNFKGWPDTGDVFHNESLRQECLLPNSECGGHSVLLTGYDLDKKVFFFKNSWGESWGKNGFGTLTFESLDLYAGNDLFYAEIKKSLAIPANHKEDPLSVNSISFSSVRLQDKLKVNVEANITGTLGRSLYMSSFLAKKNAGVTEEASDTTTTMIPLSEAESKAIGEGYIRAFRYFIDPTSTLTITSAAPLTLEFLKGTEATIKKTLESDEEAFLRNSVYVYTDTDTWTVLKRSFKPITK